MLQFHEILNLDRVLFLVLRKKKATTYIEDTQQFRNLLSFAILASLMWLNLGPCKWPL